MAAAAPAPVTGSMMINLYDGTRNAIGAGSKTLVTVYDGWQHTIFGRTVKKPNLQLTGLNIFGNSGDDYRVLASASGYHDTGFFPVKVAAGVNLPVDLMLLPETNAFNFSQAKWTVLGQSRPDWKKLFATGASSTAAPNRYSDLEDVHGGALLACLLNFTTAMDQIHLAQGTVLSYLREIDFTRLAQDRIFAACDPALLDQVKLACRQGTFAPAPAGLHPGATESYKQQQFGEANVQLTFHGPAEVEVDIDYYRDTAAHLVLEVVVNAVSKNLTDPRQVYVLRWLAGRHAGVPDFDPLYTIEQA